MSAKVARRIFPALLLVLPACSGGEEADQASDGSGAPKTGGASADTEPSAVPAAGAWDLVSSGEGVALVFPAEGDPALRLFCPAGEDEILVNVGAFRPVGSEERLSFGSGGTAQALVADTRGDRLRGGVSGTGAVPRNLGALIGGPVSVSYGAQSSGPHPAPPDSLARAFIGACGDPEPPAPPPPPPATSDPAAGEISACLMQDDERLANRPLRAIGTEPFWGARIEGRCVTYSHPEDQSGTRVWTRYTANSSGGGTWTGALEGRPFVLATRRHPNCSDGMSDRRYPLAVELTVGGEQRRGCAEVR